MRCASDLKTSNIIKTIKWKDILLSITVLRCISLEKMFIFLYILSEILDINLRVCRYIFFLLTQVEDSTHNSSLCIYYFIINVGYTSISAHENLSFFNSFKAI